MLALPSEALAKDGCWVLVLQALHFVALAKKCHASLFSALICGFPLRKSARNFFFAFIPSRPLTP